METRFFLLIEDGPRAGERLPLDQPKVRIGRKPENDIVLNDSKVSGHHCELNLKDGRYELVDLKSTNGTFHEGEKIHSILLTNEDRITVGQHFFQFIQVQVEGAASPPPAAPAPKRSFVLPLLLILLLGGAGYLYLSIGGGTSGTARPVKEVAGNLLINPSLEIDADGGQDSWNLQHASPDSFSLAAVSRSGEGGLQAVFEGGGYALASSASPVQVSPGHRFRLAGYVRFQGEELAASLRAVFHSSRDTGVKNVRSIPWVLSSAATGRGFLRLEGEVNGPEGADRLSLHVVAVGGDGRVTLDDLEVVALGPAEAKTPELRGYSFLGGSGLEGIRKIDRVLMRDGDTILKDAGGARYSGSMLAADSGSAGALVLPAGDGKSVSGSALARKLNMEGNGLRLIQEAASLPAGWSLEWQMTFETDYFAERGILLLGKNRHASFNSDFQETEVASLVLGQELSQMAWHFSTPVTVRGRSLEGGFQVAIPFTGRLEAFLQVAFDEEKRSAVDLLLQAQRRDEEGDLGGALQLFGKILREYPFDENSVKKAGARFQEILREGLEKVLAVEKQEEEARFFGLRDAFTGARRQAEVILATYQDSVVALRAQAVLERIRIHLKSLEGKLDREESMRLQAIASGLESMGNKRLATKIREYLAEHYVQESEEGP